LPVDPLSLSSLLSQGFDEGPARRALRLHQNNTQEALDWLINGGTEGSEAAKVAQLEDGVRMPTTIKRIQKLKAMRRAQQDKLRREESRNNAAEEDRRTREIERKAADSSADEEDPPPKPRPAAKKTAQALDLIGFDNPPPAQSSGAQDLLSLDEPPPPMDFTRDIETSALPEMRSFDPTMCEKPPLAASVTAGTALPRRDSGDKNNDVMALMSLQAPTQPAVSSLSSTGGGYSSQTSAVDVAQLAAQANISPQQLLAAAQQLAAQQQQQQQQTLQPAVFNGGSGLDTLGGMSQAALNALSQKPATSATTTATPLDSLASLDPLSGGELF